MAAHTIPQNETGANAFDAGIFRALVDFSFTTFATPKLIRILYLLSFIGIALGAVAYFVLGLASGSAPIILAALIVIPIVTILMLIYVRVTVELLAILFKIGDNTAKMVAALQAAGTGPTVPSRPTSGAAWTSAPPPDAGGATPA